MVRFNAAARPIGGIWKAPDALTVTIIAIDWPPGMMKILLPCFTDAIGVRLGSRLAEAVLGSTHHPVPRFLSEREVDGFVTPHNTFHDNHHGP
jgi:hypothetical protein